MNKWLLAVIVLLSGLAAHAEVYTWTDSQGIIHYSDTPHEGAEKVDIPPSQSFTSPVPNNPVQDAPDSNVDKKQDEPTTYSTLMISSPPDQETIRNTEGLINVTVQVEPKLATNDRVRILLDSAPLGDPQPGLSFQLTGVNRGSHTIAVQIINEEGEVIKTSDPITVFMQQPRVNMGRNPNVPAAN